MVRKAALEGLLLLRHGDESFLHNLLLDSAHEPNLMDIGSGPYSDAYSFQQFVFKSIREISFVSSHFTSNLQSTQIRELLASLLLGSLISRNLVIFDIIMAMCQIAFSHSKVRVKQREIAKDDNPPILLDQDMGIAIVSD